MFIASGRIVMDFYNNDNVTLKHKKLDELCKDIKRKFNVSILEIADFDDPEKCVLGFAAVVPETWKKSSARDFLDSITKTIDALSFARVTVEDVDLIYHGNG